MMQRALLDNREQKNAPQAAAPVLEWDVVLERAGKEKLGVALKWIEEETDLGPIVVTDIQPNALLHTWNLAQVDHEQPAVRREGDSMRPAVVRVPSGVDRRLSLVRERPFPGRLRARGEEEAPAQSQGPGS